MMVLTGATGFLGSHLLARLLSPADGEYADDPVTALVRDDEDVAVRRLSRALGATGLTRSDVASVLERVRPLQVELDAPRLGLPGAEYRELAAGITHIWHCAALITLLGDPAELARTNVDGTRRMLELAADAPRAPRFCHVSTAYVAGTRQGRIDEDFVDGTEEFLNPYERSKHTAERVVRRWAQEHRRPVTVFRPSILLTDRPLPRRAPRHPCAVVGDALRLLAEQPVPPGRVRLQGDAGATANLMPVEYAAEAMITAAARPPAPGVTTYHLTHPEETPLRLILDVMEEVCPGLDVELVPARFDADSAERALDALTGGLTHYTRLRRTFDRTHIAGAVRSTPPSIGPAYLRRAFGTAGRLTAATAAFTPGSTA